MNPIFGCNEVDLLSLENHSKKSTLTYTPTETLAIIQWEEKNNTSLVILTIKVHTFALKYNRAHEMCLCFLCWQLRLKSLSPTYVSLRVSATIFQLFKVIMPKNALINYPGIKLEPALGTRQN